MFKFTPSKEWFKEACEAEDCAEDISAGGAPMTEQAKPREFWIYYRDNCQGFINTFVCDFNQRGFVPKEGDIHVIEVAALDELKRENERLKNELYDAKHGFSILLTENQVVTEDNQRLREALEKATRQWQHYITDRERDDLENIHHAEAQLLKQCLQALKQSAGE